MYSFHKRYIYRVQPVAIGRSYTCVCGRALEAAAWARDDQARMQRVRRVRAIYGSVGAARARRAQEVGGAENSDRPSRWQA